MAKTKKVLSAGKYGVRYGRKMRQKIIKVDVDFKKKHACPSCLKTVLKRESSGIWACKKCGLKMAGKAYKPA
ncbi:MAG: 50S ribosomal protein L37ae [Candidatus Aenigmatarchaeota archaeon]